jgi:rhodanese-related sulfurtransferase
MQISGISGKKRGENSSGSPGARENGFFMHRRPRQTKVLTSLVFLLFGIAATMSLRLLNAAPEEPLSWADVFARINREWPNVPHMSTQELAQRMAEDGDARPLLIDVRTRREYEVSHLPGAIWAETSTQIEAVLSGSAKHQAIVLYCSAGIRSSKAAARLIRSGRTNVFNLQGSIFQWANERRPIVQDGKAVDVVHPYDDRWGVLLDSQLHP